MKHKPGRLTLSLLVLLLFLVFLPGCKFKEKPPSIQTTSPVQISPNASNPSPSVTNIFLYSDLAASGAITNDALVSLQQISRDWGIQIPWPHHLPKGYEIQKVHLENSSVVFDIQEGDDDNISLEMSWNPKGGPPYKIDLGKPAVEFNGQHGQLIEDQDGNHIVWNWFPERYRPGSFVMGLDSAKSILISELVLIAASIDF